LYGIHGNGFQTERETTKHKTKYMKTIATIIYRAFAMFTFAFSGLLPIAHAVSPAPDGGYAGGNTAEGQNALFTLTTGGYNTANGWNSLYYLSTGSFNTGIGAATLFANTGDQNTATGAAALFSNTTGSYNTANGAFALFSNTEGLSNTAIGTSALQKNTTGNTNTAIGAEALFSNTTGVKNTATGIQALYFNAIGINNTANGASALFLNTTGSGNTAIGTNSLFLNTTGGFNTATGAAALDTNSIGHDNTANGAAALQSNSTGVDNTASGSSALSSNATGNNNTADGASALFSNTTGSGNTALGFGAGLNVTTANNVICISNPGQNQSNSFYIGNVRGITTAHADAIPVLIDSFGQLGTASSSRRFKNEIKPMDKASEAILALKPVTFHYKSDKANTPQFGLIAEEVTEVNPNLVVHDKNGEIYTVRYDAINAMLLNEFLKEHRKVEEQQAMIGRLGTTAAKQERTISRLESAVQRQELIANAQLKDIQTLTAQLKEQAAHIQKVSALIEVSKPTLRMAVNNP